MRHSGFTLIEILIVIALIGILTTLALPSYRSYTQKTKFSEVVMAVTPYKIAIETCAQTLGGLSNGNNNCGTPNTDNIPNNYEAASPEKGFVHSITIDYQSPNVVLTAIAQNLTDPYEYRLIAQDEGEGHLMWQVDQNSSCRKAHIC